MAYMVQYEKLDGRFSIFDEMIQPFYECDNYNYLPMAYMVEYEMLDCRFSTFYEMIQPSNECDNATTNFSSLLLLQYLMIFRAKLQGVTWLPL